MSEATSCKCIIDCAGLRQVTRMTGNIKAAFLYYLETGLIGVPASVWQEFQDIFEDEAPELAPYIKHKIIMKRSYNMGAASIAEKIQSRFSQGAYDRQSDLYAASICSIEDYILLTSKDRVADYQKMDCCTVSELVDWATQHAMS